MFLQKCFLLVGFLLGIVVLSGCSDPKEEEHGHEHTPPQAKPEAGQSVEDRCLISPPRAQIALEEKDESAFPKVAAKELPKNPVDKDLAPFIKERGLIGLVHGADRDSNLFVFSYHVPGHFFKRFNFSLVHRSPRLADTLNSLNRGDRIYVKGDLKFHGGQPHIYAEQIALLKRYQPLGDSPAGEFKRTLSVPCLVKETEGRVTALVHAIGDRGTVLVLDYKDTVFPVFVSKAEETSQLYRGDEVGVQLTSLPYPGDPKHFTVKPGGITVHEALVNRHNQVLTVEGRLTRFPKSPTINRTIWAVEEDNGYGYRRFYTLVNFDVNEKGELEELERLSAKLQAAWDRNLGAAYRGRNKFINQQVRVKVKGRFNLVSRAQANAQIFTKAEDIEVTE